MEETKKCDKCQEEQSIENFYIRRGKPMNLCKDCKKARDKEYRERPENKEKIKERNDKWNNSNKEYFKEYHSTEEQKQYRKEYYETNKDKIRERDRIYEKEYREKNRDKINEYQREYRSRSKNKNKYKYTRNRDKDKEYREKNKENIKERMNNYLKERKENDPLFKLSCNLRTNISNALSKNGYKKYSKTIEILGCSFEEFKLYLEGKFEPWMTWDNRGLYNREFNYGWDIDHLQPLCSKINRDIKKAT